MTVMQPTSAFILFLLLAFSMTGRAQYSSIPSTAALYKEGPSYTFPGQHCYIESEYPLQGFYETTAYIYSSISPDVHTIATCAVPPGDEVIILVNITPSTEGTITVYLSERTAYHYIDQGGHRTYNTTGPPAWGYKAPTYSIVDQTEITVYSGLYYDPISTCYGSDDVIVLDDYLTSGEASISYAGAHVSDNKFYSSGLDVGTYPVTASKAYANGTLDRDLEVEVTGVNFHFDPLESLCSNYSEGVALQPYTDATTTFSGTGVSNGKFYTSVSGVGTFTITAFYEDAEGCTEVEQRPLTVLPPASVDAGPPRSVCRAGDPILLSGTPSGGTWSGPGITPAGMLDPGGLSAGVHAYQYTINTGGYCENSDAVNVTVYAAPAVDAGADHPFCVYADNVPDYLLDLTVLDFSPSDLTFSATDPVVDDALDNATKTLDAHALPGTASYTLTATTSDHGCTATDQVVITISNEDSSVLTITPARLCGSGAVVLKAIPNSDDYETVWYAADHSSAILETGNSFLTPTLNATTSYYAATRHVVTGCIGARRTIEATIQPPPAVEAGQDVVICDHQPLSLGYDASPLGGSWSGVGVDADGQTFSPTHVAAGEYPVLYTYTSPSTGCTASDGKIITVGDPGFVVDGGADLAFCANSGVQPLNPITPGGTWTSPNGVVNGKLDNTLGQLTVAGINAGVYPLVYTVITDAGCVVSDTLSLTVYALPAPPAVQDGNICQSGAAVLTVSGVGSTAVYWYHSAADDAEPFHTGLRYHTASLTHTVTYYVAFVDSLGCPSAKGEIRANVYAPPAVDFGEDLYFCEDDVAYDLSSEATPSGGIISGDGVVGNTFVGGSGHGDYAVTYTYTDTISGCSNADGKVVTIGLSPSVTVEADTLLIGEPITFSTGLTDIADVTWSFGDGFTSQQAEPTHYYYTAGQYTLTVNLLLTNGCAGSYTFKDRVAVRGATPAVVTATPADAKPTLSVFSNPVPSGTAPLLLSDQPVGPAHLKIVSLQGVVVCKCRLDLAAGINVIPCGGRLLPGVYVMQISTERAYHEAKLLVSTERKR